jgi:hypothetical protein
MQQVLRSYVRLAGSMGPHSMEKGCHQNGDGRDGLDLQCPLRWHQVHMATEHINVAEGLSL